MAESTLRRVAVVGGARIPFCRAGGAYAHQSNKQMLAAAIRSLDQRCGLGGQGIDEVAAGAVLKHARDFSLTREAILDTDLDPHTSAFDVGQACGTSLETTLLIGNKIATGQIEAGIAGGVDSASDAPIALNDELRQMLLDFSRAQTNSERARLLTRLRPRHLMPGFPSVDEPRTGLSMGEHCERMAQYWQITRAAQDELAAASHANAARAYDGGFFDDLVAPYLGVTRDTNLRTDTSVEKMARLSPAFDRSGGTLTAANSTPLTDGAATVLLASEEWAAARNLPVLAYLSPHGRTAAVDFADHREGLLMAPTYAVPKTLDAAGLALSDFDFYEIHEAFAAQVLCTLEAWASTTYCQQTLGRAAALGTIDRDRLNVNGSSIALGHPFAATGARIVATLAKLLDDKGSGRGLISICAAGGQGVSAILEK